MFWMRNKENNFPIHTLISRPEPSHYLSLVEMNKNKSKIVISFLSISLKQLFWVLKGSFEYPQLFWWRNDKITTKASLGYLSYLEL